MKMEEKNLETKEDIVAYLKEDLSNRVKVLKNEGIIGSDNEYPIRYEIERSICSYLASLLHKLTGHTRYEGFQRDFKKEAELEQIIIEHYRMNREN